MDEWVEDGGGGEGGMVCISRLSSRIVESSPTRAGSRGRDESSDTISTRRRERGTINRAV